MKIFTTINPYDRLEIQLSAMRTWENNGHSIYSINSEKEIALLSETRFITFIKTESIIDDKYVKISAVKDAINSHVFLDDEVCGIVNSDIKLNASFDWVVESNKAFIGVRYDFDEPKNKTEKFIHGYDVFIFQKRHFKFDIPDFLAVGLPWWDYYIPLLFIQNNIEIYSNTTPDFIHLIHEQRYSDTVWRDIAKKFQAYINNTLFNLKEKDLYRYVYEVKTYIDSKIKH